MFVMGIPILIRLFLYVPNGPQNGILDILLFSTV